MFKNIYINKFIHYTLGAASIGIAISTMSINQTYADSLYDQESINIVPNGGTHIYSADPTARVINGKLYVYTSTDNNNCPDGTTGTGKVCMPGYQVFSTNDDLDWKNPESTKWTEHRKSDDWDLIFDFKQATEPQIQQKLPDNKKFRIMWAPDVVEKDNKFYLFYPSKGRIVVAFSNNPEGPFKPYLRKNILNGVNSTIQSYQKPKSPNDKAKKVTRPFPKLASIDPSVVEIKLDGKSSEWYMYFSADGQIYVVKLRPDFRGTIGNPSLVKTPNAKGYAWDKSGKIIKRKNGKDKYITLEAKRGGHREGPFAYTHTDEKGETQLWVMYSHNLPIHTSTREKCLPSGYSLRQVKAVNPLNPLGEYKEVRLNSRKNVVLHNYDNRSNHGSVVNWKGKTYVFHNLVVQSSQSASNGKPAVPILRKFGWNEVEQRADGSIVALQLKKRNEKGWCLPGSSEKMNLKP